ncbi:MAG TPA: wax ester/triacylglycerol synthase family O-acyltransferase [Solirubrobacteraceae bacterium]|nr:wax ester/triacylglycerol synthase family O-acyltransferase [Solirubrobacteraceae bacterium]
MPARLSALDASFLEVEGPHAHMHVGWTATLARPADGRASDFASLSDHIAGRLDRAPRYRQRLAGDPLELADPLWVDDPDFDPTRHILHATAAELSDVVDAVMSVPLDRDAPLWEMWIADGLADGTIGLVGKAHHCMVDGVAAVELVSMLLDDAPGTQAEGPRTTAWEAPPPPGPVSLAALAAGDTTRGALEVARTAARLARSPRRALRLPRAALQRTRSLARALLPPAGPSALNRSGSPRRHLASTSRPLEDLRAVKRAHATTVNDVVLAACAGALRRFAERRGEEPATLKTMVPVNVRGEDGAGGYGNRISFLFVALPCHEPEPLGRLAAVHAETARRKGTGEAAGTDAAVDALGLLPRPLRRAAAHAFASPRMFNLVVSNIPGPPVPLYLDGCELVEAYPVVPLAANHSLSIGMTTVQGKACFGLYADREALPDADELAGDLEAELDALLALA